MSFTSLLDAIRSAARTACAASLVTITGLGTSAADAAGPAAEPDGAALYAERCASCHDHPVERIPSRIFLATMRAPEDVVDALTFGAMRVQGEGLDPAQMRALAKFVTGREPGGERAPPDANLCRSAPKPLRPRASDWNGWSPTPTNTRLQRYPGIAAADVPRLKLKWAFALPGRNAYGQPVIVGDRVITGGVAGRLFALDLHSGCTLWSYYTEALFRTATVVATVGGADAKTARTLAFAGDEKGWLHAIDVETGKGVWKRQVDPHHLSRLLGAPKIHDGVLYQPVSSMEEVAAADERYPCCTFRGNVVALDPATGRQLWRAYSIRERNRPTQVSRAGTQQHAPAGGAIFNSPTIDAERGVLYVGTGDSYTDVDSDSTNAVIAVRLRDGTRAWTHQVLENDAWLLMCNDKPHANCPKELGPDFDFAASPVLARMASGREVIVAGAKSGDVFAFDPDAKGRLLWKRNLVKGSSHGGILWGPAADETSVYVATSDYDMLSDTGGDGALVALDLATGEVRWTTPAPQLPCAASTQRCVRSMIAAVSAMPGIVFAGALDGRIRAYDAKDGKVLWEFGTAGEFPAVNGVKAHGGGIDYGGQSIANGVLIVQSGSSRRPGNAVLAFTVDGR